MKKQLTALLFLAATQALCSDQEDALREEATLSGTDASLELEQTKIVGRQPLQTPILILTSPDDTEAEATTDAQNENLEKGVIFGDQQQSINFDKAQYPTLILTSPEGTETETTTDAQNETAFEPEPRPERPEKFDKGVNFGDWQKIVDEDPYNRDRN